MNASFPSAPILAKFRQGDPALIMDTVARVQATRFDLDFQAIARSSTFKAVVKSRAFWIGFLTPFGGLANIFTHRADPYLEGMRKDREALRADGVLVGHDMRCAMLMVMDYRKYDQRALNLTDAQMQDLNACLSYERDGANIYQDIRKMGLDALKAASWKNELPARAPA